MKSGVAFAVLFSALAAAFPDAPTASIAAEAGKANHSEQISLELTNPYSVTREQLTRLRKFLARKGILMKTAQDDSHETRDTSKKHYIRAEIDLSRPLSERLSDVTAEDILPLLPRNLSFLVPLLQKLTDEKCQRHSAYFLQGLHNLTKWAVQMFDSGTKVPEGILYGSNYHFGNFDECLDVQTNVPMPGGGVDKLTGQYCLATVMLSGLKNSQVQANLVDYSSTAWDSLKAPKGRRGHRKDVIHWSFCVPAACSTSDVEDFLNLAMDTSSLRGLTLDFQVSPDMCQVKRDFLLDGYDIALGIVISMFLLVVGFTTVLDLIYRRRRPRLKDSLHVKMMLCFSAYSNICKLSIYSPSPFNLDCIFGLKAITMALILLGHSTAFIFGGPSMNSNFKEEALLKIENGLLLNNPLLVDTFLMIGAFLLCRLLLVELERRKFINPLYLYIGRFVRLTPSYAIVIAIYSTWFYKMGSGPLWESKIGLERDRCRSSWWANILYINNYVNNEHLCMFQSWYLAVDSQFFLLAPAVIYPLWRWPAFGEVILVLTTLASVAVPFAVTYINHLDPVLMLYSGEIVDLSSNAMYQGSYIKTHMRGMSYMAGIALGYIIHKIQSSGYKVPKGILWTGWLIGSFTSISAMFSVVVFYQQPYGDLEAATYAAFHRVGWCLGVAWVIFACTTNNAGILYNFLTKRPFVVLSRLSYCSYLVNGLVELQNIGSLRHTRNLSNMEIAKETLSHICLTYILALLFSIFFEAPILGIESLIMKNSGKSQTSSEAKTSNRSLSSNGSYSGDSTQTSSTDHSSA